MTGNLSIEQLSTILMAGGLLIVADAFRPQATPIAGSYNFRKEVKDG